MMFTNASVENFPLRKHSLIQAMLAVNDLFFTNTTNVEKIFLEDVKDWLDKNKVRYLPNIKVTGKTGFDQIFDFVIPKSEKYPERFLQLINSPRKDNIQNTVFKWEDIKSMRDNANFYVILNDKNASLNNSVITALHNYDLYPVKWTERDKFIEQFAA